MNQNLPARIEDLPASLVDVAETLGLPVAVALIRHFGGQEVKFPVRPHDDHPVIKALGAEAGYALCRFLGGQMIYVPSVRPRRIRAEILRLQAAGHGRSEIARMLNISQRHVRRIANRHVDPRQRSLFD